MEALKVAVQPLADKDKKESPFSKEKGEFLCCYWRKCKENSLTLRQFLIQ